MDRVALEALVVAARCISKKTGDDRWTGAMVAARLEEGARGASTERVTKRTGLGR